jgi:hypothetical protein
VAGSAFSGLARAGGLRLPSAPTDLPYIPRNHFDDVDARNRAETLLGHAGLLDPTETPTVEEAVQGDPHLTEEQKLALLGVYRSFRDTGSNS